MTQRTFETTVKTKLDKDGAAFVTKLTIVQDISDEDMFKVWASKSAIIAAQRRFRDAEKVPTEYTVTLSDLAKRAQAERVVTVQTVSEDIKKLSVDEIRKLLAESVAREEADEVAKLAASGKE